MDRGESGTDVCGMWHFQNMLSKSAFLGASTIQRKPPFCEGLRLYRVKLAKYLSEKKRIFWRKVVEKNETHSVCGWSFLLVFDVSKQNGANLWQFGLRTIILRLLWLSHRYKSHWFMTRIFGLRVRGHLLVAYESYPNVWQTKNNNFKTKHYQHSISPGVTSSTHRNLKCKICEILLHFHYI
jgi:hypothetical protein